MADILVGRGVRRPAPTLFDLITGPATAAQSALGAIGSAAKGAAQATVGLPGDIESLVRMLTGGEQALPTTEQVGQFVNQYIRAPYPQYEKLGEFTGLPTAGVLSRPATQLTNEAADALVRAITRNPQATAMGVLEETRMPLANIVSPQQAKKVLKDTKVVDEDGNPLIVYHATPDAFESPIRGESYFSPNPEIADIYTSPSASSIATFAKRGDAPAVYPSYLEIKKPFDTRDPKIRKEFMEEYYGKYGNRTPLSDKGLPDWTEARDLREWMQETGKNYDGLILDEGGIPMPDGTVKSRGISYVPFDSSQIKSAISDPELTEGLLGKSDVVK